MYCKFCGRKLLENETCICVSDPSLRPAPYQNVQAVPKKSAVPSILIVLFICFFVVGILAAILVPSMLGFVKKSKISAANANAKTILKAYNSALADMDEENYNLTGIYIISSAPEGTFIYSGEAERRKPFDLDKLNKTASEYLSFETDNCFIVCEDGVAVYAGYSEKWHNGITGSYPAGTRTGGPAYYESNFTSPSSDLQDIYDHAYGVVKQKVKILQAREESKKRADRDNII